MCLKKYVNYISIALGYALMTYVVAISTKNIKNNEILNNDLFNLLLIFAILCICVILHIIIHELGHLMFGIITKYQFVSFRIGNLILIRNNKKYHVKKHYIPGMPGQCLMSPPPLVDNKYNNTLYLLGGGLFNIIIAVIAVLIGLNMHIYKLVSIYLIYIFGSTGIFFAIMNLFPMNIGSVINDGYVIFFEDKNGKLANYYLLKINAILSEVKRFSEIPSELIDSINNFDYSNIDSPCTANLYLYTGQLHISKCELEAARKCYERIATSQTIELLRSMAKCELAFLDILTNGCDANPKRILDNNAKNLIKKMSSNISILRMKYAYYLLYKNNLPKANEMLNQFNKSIDVSPVKAEAEYEIKLIKEIKRKHEV